MRLGLRAQRLPRDSKTPQLRNIPESYNRNPNKT